MEQTEIDRQVKDICAVWQYDDQFLDKIHSADPAVLCAVLPRLSSTSRTEAMMEARRDTCLAVLNKKLSDNLISTMVRLDRSANFLAWVGIAVGAIIGVASIVLPLLRQTSQ